MLKSSGFNLSMDGFPLVYHTFCSTPLSLMSSSIPGTGGVRCLVFTWTNTQACVSLRLSTACPPLNLTLAARHSRDAFVHENDAADVRGGHRRSLQYNRNMPIPWNLPHALSNIKEYLDYRDIFLESCCRVRELFGCFSTEGQLYLTHGDFLPHNILVDRSKITAVLDWETLAWGRVLGRIYPGPARKEWAVPRIIHLLHWNNPFIG